MSGGDGASLELWGEGGTWGAGKEQMGLQAPAEASGKVWALGQARWMGGRCSEVHPELWEFSPLRSTGRLVCIIAVVSRSLGDAGAALRSVAWRFVLEELLLPGKMSAGLLARTAGEGFPGDFTTMRLAPHISQPSKHEAAFRTCSGCQSVFPPGAKATSSWLHLTAALMPLIIIDCNCAKIHLSQETGAIWTVILT